MLNRGLFCQPHDISALKLFEDESWPCVSMALGRVWSSKSHIHDIPSFTNADRPLSLDPNHSEEYQACPA